MNTSDASYLEEISIIIYNQVSEIFAAKGIEYFCITVFAVAPSNEKYAVTINGHPENGSVKLDIDMEILKNLKRVTGNLKQPKP